MKKLLTLCLFALLVACEDEKEPFQKSTLSFETYLVEMVNENGKVNGVHVHFTLYNANDTIYHDVQDGYTLETRYTFDVEGNKHRACNTLKPWDGAGHMYVKPGKYFMVLQLVETGKFSHTYIEIKENELLKIRKIFTSDKPEYSYEEW